MAEIKVTFNTITPLWTGDAWEKNSEIRPSSLMGSLRFWFAFYWKVVKDGITENENLRCLENPKNNKTFENILKNKILTSSSFDEAVDKTLEDLKLSVPSRIFGCTGWKSRVKIEILNFKEENLKFDELDSSFLINTKFWIKKTLFNDRQNEPLEFFKDVEVKLITAEYWWNKYLKEFFEFLKDKLILVGGKNSFGFGFVNLQCEDIYHNNSFSSINNRMIIYKILVNYNEVNYNESKKILGFNFKYYLRKNENKRFRTINFGEQRKASRIYISNLLNDNQGKYVYLIVLNNPFSTDEKDIPKNTISKYKEWIEKGV